MGLLDKLGLGKRHAESIVEEQIDDAPPNLAELAYDGSDVRSDIRDAYGFDGDLLEIYAEGASQLVHKWHHYLPIYDRYFAPWRNKPVRFLEIGVSKGGSLSMWRRYFGPDAVIFGIDIDEDCRAYDGIDGQVRIGSQDDPEFLRKVVDEMGGVDIVLDDGSHHMDHIIASVECLASVVADGGLYMIEDLHTAYWQAWGGGLEARANFFNYLRRLIDDQHRWYHNIEQHHPSVSNHFTSLHVYDSITVLEQGTPIRPCHSQIQKT